MASRNNLRHARQQARLQRSDLSQLSGVSVRFIWAIEDDRLLDLTPRDWVQRRTDGLEDDRPQRVMQRTLCRWAKRMHQLAQALEVPFESLFPDDYLADLDEAVWMQLYTLWKLHTILNDRDPLVCLDNPLRDWGWFREESLSPVMRDDEAAEVLEHKVLTQLIQCTLAGLPPAQQQVLTLHYGLNGGPIYTIAEIADQQGVSPSAVASLEARALRRLRHPFNSRLLRDYRDGAQSDWPYSAW